MRLKKIALILGGMGLLSSLTACDRGSQSASPASLNSRYNDEQPALSGNGRFVAFITNRNGRRELVMYDLQERRYIDLPRLNRPDAIAEKPSLSYNGRYITYLSQIRGTPVIQLYDRQTESAQTVSLGLQTWVKNPWMSPDGQFIGFESSRRGQWDIEVVDRGSNIEIDIPDGSPIPNP